MLSESIDAIIKDASEITDSSKLLRRWLAVCEEPLEISEPSDPTLPHPAVVTPYTPPEDLGVVTAVDDERRNVYILGMVGIAILSRGHPWVTLDRLSLMRAITSSMPEPVAATNLPPAVRGRLNRILARSVHKDPNRRYENPATLSLEIRALLTRTGAAENPAHLIHRDAFDRIMDWIDRARQGDISAGALVGASGIGKTYLWETIHDTALRDGDRWVYVKAPQAAGRPYGVISQILEQYPQRVAALLMSSASRTFQRWCVAIAPLLAAYLDDSTGYEDAASVDPVPALAGLITTLTSDAPSFLCFDDYQWIDGYSRAVINYLIEGDDPLPVFLISRSDVSEIAPSEVVYVQSLSQEETRRFIASFTTRPDERDENPEEWSLRIYDASGGNPLAIRAMVTERVEATTVTDDVLIAVGKTRVLRLPEEVQEVVRLLALLGAPASLKNVYRYSGVSTSQIADAIRESVNAGLITILQDDEVRFVHDSIETAARVVAAGDSTAGERALRILSAETEGGDEDAAYNAARLLASLANVPAGEAEWDAVFVTAARRSIRRLAPDDAISLVETGIFRASRRARLALLSVAHEAAFILADRNRMSTYFRRISAEGESEDVTAARYLWIRRCYADSRFPGALNVGAQILKNSGIPGFSFDWSDDVAYSATFLKRNHPEAVLARIKRRGRCRNKSVIRAVDTMSRMLLPSMTIDVDRMAHLARFSLKAALDHGWTPHTGFGFIAWALFLAIRREAGAWVRPYFTCAEAIAAACGESQAIHRIAVLSTAFGMHWYRPYREFVVRLDELARAGRREGNTEYVAHAVHIGCQAMLYGGTPLEMVRHAFESGRNEIRSYGLLRTERAMAKHHQAVETLLGRTADPLRLDGGIIDEDSSLHRIMESTDRVSLAGYRIDKTILAIFADRPEMAYEQMSRFPDVLKEIALLHDRTVAHFYHGYVAFRVGEEQVGEQQLRVLRRMARSVPETHRHRYMIVRAEQQVLRGNTRRAVRLLNRARTEAETAGFIHEAALCAERLGDIQENPRQWTYAELLYTEWGGHHAVARTRRKRGVRIDVDRTAEPLHVHDPLEQQLSRVTDLDELAAFLTGALVPNVMLSEVHIRVGDKTGVRTAGVQRRDDGAIHPVSQSPDVSLLISETGPEEFRIAANSDLHRPAPGFVASSPVIAGSRCTVVGIGAAGTPGYSDSIVRLAARIVRIVAPYAIVVATKVRLNTEEQRLNDVSRQLGETERRRRQLFAAVTDAFLLIDSTCSVVYSNPAAARYLVQERTHGPSLRREIVDATTPLIRRIEEGRPQAEVRTHATTGHVFIRVAPVDTADSRLYSLTMYDITATVERETRLAQQERQLIVADRLASIGMFSAAIAHEISNPNHILQLNVNSLSVVLSWLQAETTSESVAAMEDGNSSEDAPLSALVSQAKELVSQVEDAARRIETVLQMVKSYGREGRQERWGVLDVPDVCRRAFRFSRIMASQYSDHVRLCLPDDPLSVWGEPALLEQAIVNLLKNACEALADRNGIVELRLDADDDTAIISVCDTGGGFPESLRRNIGTPFVTGRDEEGGTGLGLSIVSEIVQKHRGYIAILDGEEPFSTRVAVYLPRHSAS